jgi:DNA-binding Lrp family transcriptional regulator
VKLTERDLDIIACMAFDASLSVAQVSATIGLKDHVVRNALKNLLEEGTIRLRPYVNPFALGLMEFYAEISIETPGQNATATLTQAFVEAPTSTFVSEVAGDTHICVMFLAKTLADVRQFFEEICRQVPDVKFRKSVSAVIEVTVAHPIRGGDEAKNNTISYGTGVQSQRFDQLDAKILLLLGSGKIASRRELGAECGVAQNTIDYRLQTLQQRGILLAVGYVVPTLRDGLFRYSLRVSASRPCVELRNRLAHLALVHPAVRAVTHISGSFDYIVDVRLSQFALITAFSQELHRHLEPYVSKIEVLQEVSTHKLYVNSRDHQLFEKLGVRPSS